MRYTDDGFPLSQLMANAVLLCFQMTRSKIGIDSRPIRHRRRSTSARAQRRPPCPSLAPHRLARLARRVSAAKEKAGDWFMLRAAWRRGTRHSFRFRRRNHSTAVQQHTATFPQQLQLAAVAPVAARLGTTAEIQTAIRAAGGYVASSSALSDLSSGFTLDDILPAAVPTLWRELAAIEGLVLDAKTQDVLQTCAEVLLAVGERQGACPQPLSAQPARLPAHSCCV